MERYERYKNSGVEWIGEIPEGWTVRKIKRLSVVKRGASPRPISNLKYFDDKGEWAWVRIADVSASERYLENTTQILSDLGASLSVKMMPDTFFLSIAGTVGKPIITKIKCCIHDGFVYFPYLNTNPEYLYYIFSTGLPYQGLGKWGTQLNLNTDTVGEICIPLPDSRTISIIANYLDRKTAEIDELIVQKEQLIELYEEERTTIINQAVTKGINPDVKLKDSRIDWLREIPEHWQVTRLNRLIRVKDGTHETPKYINENENTHPLVTSKDFEKGQINFNNTKHISEEDHNSIIKRSNTEKNDIIMSMIGGNIGNMVLVSTEKKFSIKNVALFKTCEDYFIARHLFFILKSSLLKIQIDMNSRGGAQSFLSLDDLRSLIYFVLPYNEIKSIIQHIETKTARINAKIEKTKKIIDLQKEYRTALISEVVTGKIKVTQESAS